MLENTTRWDIGVVNKLIGFTFKKNIYITVANLRNLQRLLNESDFEIYRSKPTLYKRIMFLKKALEAKLDEKLEDESLIIQYCRPATEDSTVDAIISNLQEYKKLSHQEIQFLIKYINDRLHFGILQIYIDKMADIVEKVRDGEYQTYAHAAAMVDNLFIEYSKATREVRTRYQNNILDFNDPNLKDKVSDVLKRLGNTSSIIITGIQLLNEMLSPGFKPGKVYCIMGVTGGYKSAMLLTVALDAVKYNAKSYKPKKEGHKAYVVYLTMENSKDESFERAYNMEIANDDPVDHDSGWIIEQLTKAKIAYNDDIGLLIWYEPGNTITPNDIRRIIDELDSQGKEVILLSLDYLKRMCPNVKCANTKESLKSISEDLHNVASDYLIPIVTAQQLNRAALTVINIAKRNGETDLVKHIGLDNVGDAWEVAEIADMTIIIVVERRKSDGRLMLAFYRAKHRYRPATNLEYFYQPFVMDNELTLERDIYYDKPVGVHTIGADMDMIEEEELFTDRGRRQLKRRGQNVVGQDYVSDELFSIPAL